MRNLLNAFNHDHCLSVSSSVTVCIFSEQLFKDLSSRRLQQLTILIPIESKQWNHPYRILWQRVRFVKNEQKQSRLIESLDFQVAGVSRSGRVRKKSSKLLDFESPEEIEKRTKRPGRQPARYPGRGRPPNALREREQELALAYEEDEEDDLEPNHSLSDEEETSAHIGGAAILMNSDDEVDTLVQDLVEGVEAEASYTNDSRVRQSLYMREKSNKRKILKDNKLQRKDKVRVRYTAYSLWAREVRKRDFPDLGEQSQCKQNANLF